MNKVIKDHKIAIPITRKGVMQLCKAMNMHCTVQQSYEAIIACRGKYMDDADPEEFDMDKLVSYLSFRSKFMPPADNPRAAVSQNRQSRRVQQLNLVNTMQNTKNSLPPLRQHIYNANRHTVRSQ